MLITTPAGPRELPANHAARAAAASDLELAEHVRDARLLDPARHAEWMRRGQPHREVAYAHERATAQARRAAFLAALRGN